MYYQVAVTSTLQKNPEEKPLVLVVHESRISEVINKHSSATKTLLVAEFPDNQIYFPQDSKNPIQTGAPSKAQKV